MKAELASIRSDIEEYFLEREEREAGDFLARYDSRSLQIARHLHALYHAHREWPQCMGAIFLSAAESFHLRGPSFRSTDRSIKEDDPLVRQAEALIGELDPGLIGGEFSDLSAWIPYFQELGLTQLHLIPSVELNGPLFSRGSPTWPLGSLESGRGFPDSLGDLARDLRAQGILLGVDFALDHTSREHFWAKKAMEGDPYYRRFYHFFPDRSVPDRVEGALRSLGVDPNPTRFAHLPESGEWVWTTLSPGHWDLDYANPWVFRQMLEEMLALANAGPGVIRLKGGPFLWKEVGTSCQSLPETGYILEALAGLVRMAAPGVLLRDADPSGERLSGEHRRQRGTWSIDQEGMGAALWAALASGDTLALRLRLDREALRAGGPAAVSLGTEQGLSWNFDPNEAAKLGLDREAHQRWLAEFFSGELQESLSQGRRFQAQPPGSRGPRVMGSTASLTGLGRAQRAGDESEVALAIRRVLMLYSVLFSLGVVPRLRLGDEVGLIEPGSISLGGAELPQHDREGYAERAERRHDRRAVEGQIFQRLRYLIQLRKRVAAFKGDGMQTVYTGDPALLGYLRGEAPLSVLCLINFSSQEMALSSDILELAGLGRQLTDLVTGEAVWSDRDLMLAPYQFVWLQGEGGEAAQRRAGG